jgi:glutathione S-transferase
MSLTLYYHPLASYCWKVLIALYENETPFERELVDLSDEPSRVRFLALAPLGKFPVIRDGKNGRIVGESSIVIEYLAHHYPGSVELVPADPDRALEARFRERFYDLYVHDPMQRIVGDRLRPAEHKDPYGVARWKDDLRAAYALIERDMKERTWAAGEAFTMADCAAAPSLYYANRIVPFGEEFSTVARYFERLRERPSFARTFKEAGPYLHNFPEG